VEIRIMTDEGTSTHRWKSMGELQIKGHGLSILTLKKTRIALQMTDGLKPVM
jgi:hypothetical protein